MIKVGVVGGTGYTGVELLRLLARHPKVELTLITSRGEEGKLVSDLFPNLRGAVDLHFSVPDNAELKRLDLVFFATPNGVAMRSAPALLEAGVRVIDLAADFRLKDATEWQQWYGEEHVCPDWLTQAVYGLCEINREKIRDAQLVANPGCYPTAVQLGFLPLVEQGLIQMDRMIADCKSGVSGAGRKASVPHLLCECSESFKAYSVAGHRHLPEIAQGLQLLTDNTVDLTFVPHLTPMLRGIHASLYAVCDDHSVDLQSVYEQFYTDEPFVDVMPPGAHPETKTVRGSNTCRLAVHRPQQGNTVVVLSIIDNLTKGAAGQAVQNMNIMFGLDETTGLSHVALMP